MHGHLARTARLALGVRSATSCQLADPLSSLHCAITSSLCSPTFTVAGDQHAPSHAGAATASSCTAAVASSIESPSQQLQCQSLASLARPRKQQRPQPRSRSQQQHDAVSTFTSTKHTSASCWANALTACQHNAQQLQSWPFTVDKPSRQQPFCGITAHWQLHRLPQHQHQPPNNQSRAWPTTAGVVSSPYHLQSWRCISGSRLGTDNKQPRQTQSRQQQQQQRKNEPRVNHQIRAPQLMVVFPDGSNQIMDNASAKAAARALDLDLMEVNARNDPPVVRILDYGQHRYKQQKIAEEAEKQKRLAQKLATPKEMQFSARIGDHDLETKMRKVLEFLEDGLRVQLTVKHKRDEDDAASDALDYLLARIQSDFAVEAGTKQKQKRAVSLLVKPKAQTSSS